MFLSFHCFFEHQLIINCGTTNLMIPVTNQILKTLQFHFYGVYKNFLTEFVEQSLKFIDFPQSVITSKHKHVHPINHFNNMKLPYIIINNQQIICGQRIFKMILTLLVQGQQQRNFDAARPSIANWLLDITPVFRICMEINEVAQVYSDIELNDYYTLISPFKKYQYHQFQKSKKKTLQSTTYFVKSTGELDKDYFLLKLEQLHRIVLQYDKNQPNPIIYYLVCLMLQILPRKLKHLNKILYQTVIADQIYSEQAVNRRQLKKQRIKQAMKQRVPQSLYITNINIRDEELENKKKKKEAEKRAAQLKEQQEGKNKTIVKFFVGNLIFWGFYFML